MRIPLIAGNWKMNTTVSEAVTLVNELRPGLDTTQNVDKVICPPFVSLAKVKELLQKSSTRLGAQNLYFEEKGAFTGEISPLMLIGLCEFVIIGHSERRQYFNETDSIINKKIKTAVKAGLKPILCVGEKLAENEAGRTEDIVTRQLELALAGVDNIDGLTAAYEPIWAIGTGKAASGKQANDVIALIRRVMGRLYGERTAQETRILYGGSVTATNTAEFLNQPEIDGSLVGGASLKADQFLSIVRQTAEIRDLFTR